MVSDDCVSPGLVDEWLQVRNALSIEIFLRDTLWGSSPRLLRPKASPTSSSGGNEHSAASVRHPAFVDAGDDRHPSIGAEDMHSGRTRLVIPPDRSFETARAPCTAEGARGVSPKNFDTQRER